VGPWNVVLRLYPAIPDVHVDGLPACVHIAYGDTLPHQHPLEEAA